MSSDRIKNYGIIVGLVVQTFLAGVAWGTLWNKVSNLERLMYIYVANFNERPQGGPFGPREARANTRPNSGENNSGYPTVSDSVVRPQVP